jgi:hypothetical protein
MWSIVRNSITSSARARISSSSRHDGRGGTRRSTGFRPTGAAGTIIRFSRTVIEWNSCAIWKVRSSPLWNSSCGGRPVMSSPPIQTGPRSAAAPGDDVEKRGLAGAVRADQPGDRALGDLQRGAVDGAEAAEMLVQVVSTGSCVPPGPRPRYCLGKARARLPPPGRSGCRARGAQRNSRSRTRRPGLYSR